MSEQNLIQVTPQPAQQTVVPQLSARQIEIDRRLSGVGLTADGLRAGDVFVCLKRVVGPVCLAHSSSIAGRTAIDNGGPTAAITVTLSG